MSGPTYRSGLRRSWLASIGEDIAALRKRGVDVVVVSSGAVALGRGRLGLKGPLRLEEKQAASSAGQTLLTEAWQTALAPHDLTVAQILLTLDDTEDRRRYLNARATLSALLDLGAVPLINENDTIATAEIRYGDNDRLAAHVAQLIGADLLVILSDIDGLYATDPRVEPSAQHFSHIPHITPDIEAMAGAANASAGVGSGGMASKLAAAKLATGSGCATIIALGNVDAPMTAIENGARATLFAAQGEVTGARKQWIGGRLAPKGALTVDQGAAAAVRKGASLLPAGVTQISGEFARGDAVTISERGMGAPFAQGLVTYDADDLRRIAGRRSTDIEAMLGYRRRPAVVEASDLVLF